MKYGYYNRAILLRFFKALTYFFLFSFLFSQQNALENDDIKPKFLEKFQALQKFSSKKIERLSKEFPSAIAKFTPKGGQFTPQSIVVNDKLIKLLGWTHEKFVTESLNYGIPGFCGFETQEIYSTIKDYKKTLFFDFDIDGIVKQRSQSRQFQYERKDKTKKDARAKIYYLPSYEDGKPILNIVMTVIAKKEPKEKDEDLVKPETIVYNDVITCPRQKRIENEQKIFKQKFYQIPQEIEGFNSKVCKIRYLDERTS